jgi:hypothetical protein
VAYWDCAKTVLELDYVIIGAILVFFRVRGLIVVTDEHFVACDGGRTVIGNCPGNFYVVVEDLGAWGVHLVGDLGDQDSEVVGGKGITN